MRHALFCGLLLALAWPAQGLEPESVIWEKPVYSGFSKDADELKELLAEEVGKMLKSGHLLPYFTRRGELNTVWCFTNPGDLVRALARAYPYLAADQQEELKTYLKKEMEAYPPCSDKLIAPTEPGTPRQLFELPRKDFEWDPNKLRREPRLHNVYSLWLYADATGDWGYVQANWAGIGEFYRKHAKDATACFGGMSGPIGMARMARKIGKAEEATACVQAAQQALAAAAKEPEMRQAMLGRHGFQEKWNAPFHYAGYHFLHLAPEVARHVRETPEVKKLVVEQTAEGTHRLPMWFVSQASCFMRCYGESHAITPSVSAMIFPIKAWVEQVPFARLRDWVSAEDAPRGDLFYIERLVTAIEACGREEWKDVRR